MPSHNQTASLSEPCKSDSQARLTITGGWLLRYWRPRKALLLITAAFLALCVLCGQWGTAAGTLFVVALSMWEQP